jgi:hypothetical protein
VDDGVTPETIGGRGAPPLAWEARAARDPGRRAGSGPRSPGDVLTLDTQARSGSGTGRHHDVTDRDVTEEEEWVTRDRQRPPLLLVATIAVTVAAAVAIVFGVMRFGSAGHVGDPGRPGDSVVASRGPATADRVVTPPVGEGTGSAASAAREQESTPVSAAKAQPARAAVATPEPQATLPPPPRSPNDLPAAGEEETSRPHVPAPESSEERVANFLIEQFGPATAAEKALSTAAWYEVGRPERAYWERVAEAIRRRTDP